MGRLNPNIIKMKKVKISIKGIRPIIMHNGRTSDPLDEYARKLKKVSAKRNKTEDDHALMAEIEFEAGLYWSDEMGVYMPVDNLQRMFLDACKKLKLGRQSVGIMVDAEYGVPLNFPHSKNWNKLKSTPEYVFRKAVSVASAKVMRTRPLIPTGWTAEIPVELDTDLIDVDTFESICDIAGLRIGLGDWRPGAPRVPGPFGRFIVESFTQEK